MNRRGWLLALLLLAMTLVVFWPATRFGFVNYDDRGYVYENAHVLSGLSLDNARWAMTSGAEANWHPLTWLSLMLDTTLYAAILGTGPDAAPSSFGYHLTNIVLHALNATLLLVVLLRATGSTWRSALVAALFAVHPLRVESVAWVAERKDVLSTFFVLLAILAYLRHARRGGWGGYALMLLCFAASLMSKPMYVTLPFWLLLFDYWPLRRFSDERLRPADGPQDFTPRRWGVLILEKVPLLLLAIASSWVTVVVQRQGGAVMELVSLPLGVRLANVAIAPWFYLWKTVWPTRLAAIYPLQLWPWWEASLAAAGLVLVSAAVIWRYRRWPWLAVGWFWFLGTLVPVIGLVQVGSQAAADRYTYFPTVGLLVAIVWSIPKSWLRDRGRSIALTAAAACVLAAMIVMTATQIGVWRDSETLFLHALEVTHENHIAAYNAGEARLVAGNLEGAAEMFRRSARYAPDTGPAHEALGQTLIALRRPEEAIPALREALRVAPHPHVHVLIGTALLELNEPAEAARHLAFAVAEAPGADALDRLALALLRTGRFAEAEQRARQGLALNPDHAGLHFNLGVAQQSLNRLEEAERSYRRALELQPDFAGPHNNLGILLASRGRLDEAATHFREAVRLEPADRKHQDNLARALKQLEAGR